MRVFCHAESVEPVDTRLIGTGQKFVQESASGGRVQTPVAVFRSKMCCRSRRQSALVEFRLFEGDAECLQVLFARLRRQSYQSCRVDSSTQKNSDRDITNHVATD